MCAQDCSALCMTYFEWCDQGGNKGNYKKWSYLEYDRMDMGINKGRKRC